MVLVDHAAEDASSPYQPIDRDRRTGVLVGWVPIQALMWTVPVEMALARGQSTPVTYTATNPWSSAASPVRNRVIKPDATFSLSWCPSKRTDISLTHASSELSASINR